MEKKRKLIQVYAILVNVVAVITFLITATGFTSNMIDRAEPLYSGRSNIDLSSFGKYKMDVLRATTKDAAYVPTDEEISEMYAAAKTFRIEGTLHRTYRDMVVNGILIMVAIILFGFHWNLMKKHELSDE